MKYLITGLGNIGPEYTETRHNIGFFVLDALANELETIFEPSRYADIARAKFRGKQLILAKPSTFMNRSGLALRYWLKKENIPLDNSLTVVDDIALPLGTLRVRKKGGDGGHNGLISIIQTLATTEFSRLRFGIGDEFPRGYQVDYVLGEWTPEEREVIKPKIDTSVKIIKSFIASGIERTMNIYNTKS